MRTIATIVPFHNNEAYLAGCIQSLLNQTYKDTLVVLVNDGSIDNSLAIALDKVANYDNVVLINLNGNFGASGARNMGLRLLDLDLEILATDQQSAYNTYKTDNERIDYIASSMDLQTLIHTLESVKYVNFLDGDDLFALDGYERIVERFTKYQEVKIVAFNVYCKYIDVAGISGSQVTYSMHKFNNRPFSFLEMTRVHYNNSNWYSSKLFPYFCFMVHGVYDRELVRGYRFVEGIVGEDQIFGIEIFTKLLDKKAISHINAPFYTYNRYVGSSTTSSHKKIPLYAQKYVKGDDPYFHAYSYINMSENFRRVGLNLPMSRDHKELQIFIFRCAYSYAFSSMIFLRRTQARDYLNIKLKAYKALLKNMVPPVDKESIRRQLKAGWVGAHDVKLLRKHKFISYINPLNLPNHILKLYNSGSSLVFRAGRKAVRMGLIDKRIARFVKNILLRPVYRGIKISLVYFSRIVWFAWHPINLYKRLRYPIKEKYQYREEDFFTKEELEKLEKKNTKSSTKEIKED